MTVECIAKREDGAKHLHQVGDYPPFEDGYCFGWHYGSHPYVCCLNSDCQNNRPPRLCDLEGMSRVSKPCGKEKLHNL